MKKISSYKNLRDANLYNPYNIFPKNYNFLEKYIWLCYTTSIERFGEKHETRDLIRTD